MPIVAFISMDSLEGFITDDELLYPPLEALGWKIETISWRDSTQDWSRFDAVVIRTPWDYQDEPEAFFESLARIEASDTFLANPLHLVKWNIDKRYLFELEAKGVELVPTLNGSTLTKEGLQAMYAHFDTHEVVVKPVVGANADFTYRLPKGSGDEAIQEALDAFSDRQYLAQPFMDGIVNEGEFSLLYFGGEYSHTALKVPKTKDFRVQEEHGGLPYGVAPEPALKAAADLVIKHLPDEPLYARVDLVRTKANTFALMEVELIEPALYVRMDEASPARFAAALTGWWQEKVKASEGVT